MELYCSYYQAHIVKRECLFFVAIFRSFDHLAFDRTFDISKSIFEFFVPQEMEKQFLKIMEFFIHQGVVTDLCKMSNRLMDETQTV